METKMLLCLFSLTLFGNIYAQTSDKCPNEGDTISMNLIRGVINGPQEKVITDLRTDNLQIRKDVDTLMKRLVVSESKL